MSKHGEAIEAEAIDGKKKRPGLPANIQKQLLEDIEAQGGLEKYRSANPDSNLCSLLCDKNPSLYGKRGDPIRRQIQNKIYKWTLLSENKYLSKVLLRFQVPPTKERRRQKRREGQLSNTSQGSCNTSDNVPTPTPAPAFKPVPKPPVARTNKQTATMAPASDLGEKIVVALPKGLYFIGVWAECNLSNLEFAISEDGYSVLQRAKKPNPKDASNLLSYYPWAGDTDNVVVSTVEDALDKLKKQSDPDEWTELKIVNLDEEVIRAFVDHRGNPLTEDVVGHKVDEDGRQFITFFLKTMAAHRTAPKKATFPNNGPSSGVNGGGNDDDDMFEDTVREEMEDRFNEIGNRMSSIHNSIHNMQEQNAQAQQQFAQQMQQQAMEQQQRFMQEMFRLMTQQQQHPPTNPHPQGPIPDGAPSGPFNPNDMFPDGAPSDPGANGGGIGNAASFASANDH